MEPIIAKAGAQTRARPGSHPPDQLSGGQSAIRTGGAGEEAIRHERVPQGSARPAARSSFDGPKESHAAPKRIGTKVRGVGVSLSCFVGGTIGFDGLLVIKPDGRITFQSGIGNLGTESVSDVHRAGCGNSGSSVGEVRHYLGRLRRRTFPGLAFPAAARRRMP